MQKVVERGAIWRMHFMEYDSPVMTTISKITDVFILSSLWVICCIPIITIGAATTALYYSSVKAIRKDKGYVIKSFFHSFRMNFIPATLLWLVFLLVGILLYGCFIFTAVLSDKSLQFFMLCFYMFLFFLFLGVGCYAFPVLSKCSMDNMSILRFSLGLVIRHFPSTILLVLFVVLAVLVMWTAPLAVLILPGTISLLYSLPMERILIRYTPQEV